MNKKIIDELIKDFPEFEESKDKVGEFFLYLEKNKPDFKMSENSKIALKNRLNSFINQKEDKKFIPWGVYFSSILAFSFLGIFYHFSGFNYFSSDSSMNFVSNKVQERGLSENEQSFDIESPSRISSEDGVVFQDNSSLKEKSFGISGVKSFSNSVTYYEQDIASVGSNNDSNIVNTKTRTTIISDNSPNITPAIIDDATHSVPELTDNSSTIESNDIIDTSLVDIVSGIENDLLEPDSGENDILPVPSLFDDTSSSLNDFSIMKISPLSSSVEDSVDDDFYSGFSSYCSNFSGVLLDDTTCDLGVNICTFDDYLNGACKADLNK